jgi:hypothetical protein
MLATWNRFGNFSETASLRAGKPLSRRLREDMAQSRLASEPANSLRILRYPAIPAYIGQGLKSHPQATFGCGDFALIKTFVHFACASRIKGLLFA